MQVDHVNRACKNELIMPDDSDGTAPGIEFGETIAEEAMPPSALAETEIAELVGTPRAARSGRAKPEPLRCFPASSARRDIVLMLGGAGAGKTVFAARLYEALWSGVRLLKGRVDGAAGPISGERAVRTITGKARDIKVHHDVLRIAGELAAGKWPASNVGLSHLELEVTLDGVTELVSLVDYPGGELDRAINWQGSDPLSAELVWLAQNASAVIVFIDPECVSVGGTRWDEDLAAITHAVTMARRGAGREDIPVSVVVTKVDRHNEFVQANGGVKGVLAHRARVLSDVVQPATYWPTSAISAVATVGGWMKPKRKRPPMHVVEPFVYCLAMLERQRELRKRFAVAEASLRDIEPFVQAARQAAVLEAQALERRLPQFYRACIMLVGAMLLMVLSMTVLGPRS
jgi:hypothetical protein